MPAIKKASALAVLMPPLLVLACKVKLLGPTLTSTVKISQPMKRVLKELFWGELRESMLRLSILILVMFRQRFKQTRSLRHLVRS